MVYTDYQTARCKLSMNIYMEEKRKEKRVALSQNPRRSSHSSLDNLRHVLSH